MANALHKYIVVIATTALFISVTAATLHAQTIDQSQKKYESARSDRLTGGRIEKTTLEPGQPDIKITVNVPAFQLTLWQNNKEVKTYPVGVGRKEFPIVIGKREATEIIWNPAWIPPDSDWVDEFKGVRPGEVIKAGDKRNPLGKLKIPLGGGYLIHQAEKPTDLGHLVSHGCIRMLRTDLYDLAEKIIAARSLPVTQKQIERARKTTKPLVVKLDSPLVVDINYDTQVVEEGVLHLYPDVYDRGTNTTDDLRTELQDNGINTSNLSDKTLVRMIDRARNGQEYVVSMASIAAGSALTDGQIQPLVLRSTEKRPPIKKRPNSLH